MGRGWRGRKVADIGAEIRKMVSERVGEQMRKKVEAERE